MERDLVVRAVWAYTSMIGIMLDPLESNPYHLISRIGVDRMLFFHGSYIHIYQVYRYTDIPFVDVSMRCQTRTWHYYSRGGCGHARVDVIENGHAWR